MKLISTTERLTVKEKYSSLEEYLLFLMHIATYKFCINYIKGKVVLDYGCGSGYGTAFVSEHCSRMIGVDVSTDAIDYAKVSFNSPNLSFMKVEKSEDAKLPFPDESFDVVLSLQVIEHIPETTRYLNDINRVLKPNGQLIIATPDRSNRLFSFQKPWNRWHVREYSREQFGETLEKIYSDVTVKQLGGKDNIIVIEMNRIKKIKWLMLPFTLPFIPETIRIQGLRLMQYLNNKLIQRPKIVFYPKFDDTSISISDYEKYSAILIATAQKRGIKDS